MTKDFEALRQRLRTLVTGLYQSCESTDMLAILDALAAVRSPVSSTAPQTEREQRAGRIFEAVVHTYEGQDDMVPEDVRDASFVRRARVFRLASAAPPTPPQTTWRCFHCDEVFTNEAEAREHFGRNEFSESAHGVTVSAFRAMEEQIANLIHGNEELDNTARLWHEAEEERKRLIGNRQWHQELDYREGEKLALQEQLAQLASSAQPTPDARGWQTIDSAPKDGTVVLVWWPIGDYPSGNHEFATFVAFTDGIPDGTYDGQPYRPGWCNDRDGAYLPVEPTHWMPLASPPSSGEK